MFRFHPDYGYTRALEAHLAIMMISVGFILLWPGETFSLPHYDVLKGYLNEPVGGLFLLCVGLCRAISLWVNGRRTPTPLPRLLCSMIGVGFWFALFLSMEEAIRTGEAGVPPLMFGVSFAATVMEFYSGMRAGADVSHLRSLGGLPIVAKWLRPR